MSLIVGNYYRGDPRAKPGQWGNLSDVRSAMRHWFDRYGIPSPVLYLPFWGNAGTPTDLSDHGNLCTYQGTFWSDDGAGYDSAYDYVAVPDHAAYTFANNFTFNFNLRSSDNTAIHYLIGQTLGDSGYRTLRILLYYDGGSFDAATIQVLIGDALGLWDIIWYPSVAIPQDLDCTLTLTYDGSTAKIYKDGRLADSHNDGTASIKVTNQIWRIGDGYGEGYAFSGVLKTTNWFTTALTESQVALLSDQPYAAIQPLSPIIYSFPSVAASVVSLTLAALQHTHALDSLTLGQFHDLVIAALQASHSLDGVTVGEAASVVSLTLAALQHTHSLDNLTVGEIVSVIDLVVSALQHTHSLDNLTVGESVTLIALTVEALQHLHNIDGAALSQWHNIASAGLQHSHTLANITLNQLHQVILENLQHGHAIDSVTIGASVVLIALTLASLKHSVALEGLSIGEFHILIVDGLGHSHFISSVGLSQFHTLLIDALQHSHNLESISFNLSISEGSIAVHVDVLKGTIEIKELGSWMEVEKL